MRYIVILIAVLTIGCSAKRKVSKTVIKEKDSVAYVLPSDNRLVIANLCDTLYRPLEVLKTINTGVSTTTVRVKDNKLEVITKNDTIFKDRISYRDREVIKETTKYKTNIVLMLCLVLGGLVIGYFRVWRLFGLPFP